MCVCVCVCLCEREKERCISLLVRSGLERGEMQTFYYYLTNNLLPRHLSSMELSEVGL